MRADWSKIIAGDIVNFAYRGKNSTQFRTRTCLILNEKHYLGWRSGFTIVRRNKNQAKTTSKNTKQTNNFINNIILKKI